MVNYKQKYIALKGSGNSIKNALDDLLESGNYDDIANMATFKNQEMNKPLS